MLRAFEPPTSEFMGYGLRGVHSVFIVFEWRGAQIVFIVLGCVRLDVHGVHCVWLVRSSNDRVLVHSSQSGTL